MRRDSKIDSSHHLASPSMPNLPDSIATISEVIGEPAALKLIREWPRTSSSKTGRSRVVLYVPTTIGEGHKLIDILGDDAARALVSRFGGELMFLASCSYVGAQERREQIARAVFAGMPRDRAAIHFDVSHATVRRAIRGFKVAMPVRAPGADHAAMHTTTTRTNA